MGSLLDGSDCRHRISGSFSVTKKEFVEKREVNK
jgi:hypothetical protein